MSRAAIWNDANCLAARSARPTFWIPGLGQAVDALSVYYAQEVYRGQPPQSLSDAGPQIRLDETKLPDRIPDDVAPSLLPRDSQDEIFVSGMNGQTSHLLSGRTLALCDVFTSTSEFIAGTNQRTLIVISEGRHRPAHRMRGKCFLNSFFSSFSDKSTSVDFGPFTDAVGDFFALKTTHVPLLVMCVPKISGAASLEGVYVALRPMLNTQQFRQDGQAVVDYTLPTLPLTAINLVEIGTFTGTTFTPRSRLVAAFGDLEVDAGLARESFAKHTGTQFCCVIRGTYSQAIQFPYVPPSADHCLCGTLSANAPSAIVSRQTFADYRLLAFVSTGRKGFAGGECPAFPQVALDHGTLIRVPFYAGAPRSQHFTSVPASYFGPVNVAPQWSTWQHSQFPYTLHKTGAITVDGSVVPMEQLSGQRALNTPIYGLLDDYSNPNLKTVEHYPERTVIAKAARVQATANGSHFEDAAMTIGKPRDDGKMVFNGKVINGVSLSFVPYARQYLGGAVRIFSGISAASLPQFQPTTAVDTYLSSTELGSNTFLEAAFNNRFNVWWRYRQTVNLPPNAYGPFGADKIQRGEWCEIFEMPIDGKTIEEPTPFTAVTAQKEIDAHLYGACFAQLRTRLHTPPNGTIPFRAPNYSLSGSVDEWRLGRSSGEPWKPGGFPTSGDFTSGIMAAPLTGTYNLSRFSVGDIPTAGNMFQYSGNGKWSFNSTVTYNLHPKITSVDDYWQPRNIFDFSGRQFHELVSSRTSRYATVPVTENWKMKADHVELYCSLGSALQQAGEFQADPSVQFDNEQSQRNWIRETFMKHDQPRGRIAETVVYVDGLEPSPVLTMTLRYRTAMRAELTCSVNTTDLPNYPHSMTNSSSGIIANTVAGMGGVGNVSGQYQTVESHHGYSSLSFTFSKEQTAQLMNGEEVLAMQWQKETNPQRPVFVDTGGIFLHAFRVKLDVAAA